MNRGEAPLLRRRLRTRARLALKLFLLSLLLVAAAPLYAYLATCYSGHLTLAQTASAADAVRGFDFGPVYLERGSPGRYFISAVLPQCNAGHWLTRFEVLNSQRQSVFREDEVRFIGDFQFRSGERDRYSRTFTLKKDTGYYYFRFTAVNGEYSADAAAPPVVGFAIRQGVISGLGLWLPVAGALFAALLCACLAIVLIRRIAVELALREEDRHVQPPPPATGLTRVRPAGRPSGHFLPSSR